MRALLCCLICLFLAQPLPVRALESTLVAHESELAAAEERLAVQGDGLAWSAWRAVLNKIAKTAGSSDWPASMLHDLAMRAKGAIARHAHKDATGLYARVLLAEALGEMAEAGSAVMLKHHNQGELFKGEQKQLARLWALAYLAWQDYLLTEQTRGGVAGLWDRITGNAPMERDTSRAWEQWWLCLHRFCTETPAFADRDIALTRAVTMLQQYSLGHPGDIHAWRAWSEMLLWQGKSSADPVVRIAFFEDAAVKQNKLLSLPEAEVMDWTQWLNALRTLVDTCSTTEECSALRRQFNAFNESFSRRFAK